MSQPDETHGCAYCGDEHPARVACRWPSEPEPDSTCPGCEGDGACHCDECLTVPGTHDSCEWCGPHPAPTAGGSADHDETPGHA